MKTITSIHLAFIVSILQLISGNSFTQEETIVVNGKEMKVVNDRIALMSKAEELAHNALYRDKATTCAGAANVGAVVLQDCNDVGTAGFYTQALDINFTNSGSTAPGVAESCAGVAGYGTNGTWVHVNPDPGVDIIDLQVTSGAVGGGSYNIWCQAFQGSCAALVGVGCQQVAGVTMGIRYATNAHFEGINPAQDVWFYVWEDAGGSPAFNLNLETIGSSSTTITNDNCAGASTSNNGCNLGADADNSWTGPSNNGKACTGGTWFSNENTVYFSVTATAATGTIDVSGINCNNGVAGQAQFGVWNSCACVGSYTVACYKSCAVGAGTLSLAALTPGSTYIIVVDGQAGDICTWQFTTTGLNFLPVEIMNISGKVTSLGNLISWKTGSERDCKLFHIQRSEDGEHFTTIGQVAGSGTTSSESQYAFLDEDHGAGVNYYRLIQEDVNGNQQAYAPIMINNQEKGIKISPNPVSDEALVQFGSSFEGTSTVHVVDLSGKVIHSEQVNTIRGGNEFNLSTATYAPGMYLLVVSNEKETTTIKFSK